MSRRSDTDNRFQQYADIFGSPETSESIEHGFRALHWEFMENYQQSTGRLVVERHAREAQVQARQRIRGRSRRRP